MTLTKELAHNWQAEVMHYHKAYAYLMSKYMGLDTHDPQREQNDPPIDYSAGKAYWWYNWKHTTFMPMRLKRDVPKDIFHDMSPWVYLGSTNQGVIKDTTAKDELISY